MVHKNVETNPKSYGKLMEKAKKELFDAIFVNSKLRISQLMAHLLICFDGIRVVQVRSEWGKVWINNALLLVIPFLYFLMLSEHILLLYFV